MHILNFCTVISVIFANSLVSVTTAYGPSGGGGVVQNGINGISIAGDSPGISFASSAASTNSAGGAVSASGLASTVAGFEQITGQLPGNLKTGDMVVINNRRYLAVRPASDGRTSTTILIESSDDSYTLDAKVRDSVSQNLNAKSDGYSKTVASAIRDFSSSGSGGSGLQSIVVDAPTVSAYTTPTTSTGVRQSVVVEAASSSGFGAVASAVVPPTSAAVPTYSSGSAASVSRQTLKTSVDARDQHSYSSVSANSRLNTPTGKDGEGEWDYSELIPGVAGVDYPILAAVPATSFNCANRWEGGYYADVDTGCQVYHVCALGKKFSFLCANGTLFNQKTFVCEWWFNVDCASSPLFYELNLQIGAPATQRTVSASSAKHQASVIQPISLNVPKVSYGAPPVQQSSSVSVITQREPASGQVFEVKPPVQSVTIEQSIKPSYGVPRPQKASFQPVVIQQQSFDRPSFGQSPPPAVQASVAASAY